jgi:hypothetical protein
MTRVSQQGHDVRGQRGRHGELGDQLDPIVQQSIGGGPAGGVKLPQMYRPGQPMEAAN